MTVEQLITKLKKLPKDAELMSNFEGFDNYIEEETLHIEYNELDNIVNFNFSYN